MFDKLLAIQQKAEEIKKRLDTISVQAEVEGGKIRVSATANKHITAIMLDADFLKYKGTMLLDNCLKSASELLVLLREENNKSK